ncbi:hypothetical protein ACIQZO_03935 [Streptomyces sp. NPDC097617]|uniref:hypothetical protein n=1 Tax=Streptomyces sp. NPDC097617 TaxID=3366091 RepID=UPI0038078F0A
MSRLTDVTEGAYGGLAHRKDEILRLTARIRQGAQEIHTLQEALENAWQAIRRHAEQFAATTVEPAEPAELAELAERLSEQASEDPEPTWGPLVEWFRSLEAP